MTHSHKCPHHGAGPYECTQPKCAGRERLTCGACEFDLQMGRRVFVTWLDYPELNPSPRVDVRAVSVDRRAQEGLRADLKSAGAGSTPARFGLGASNVQGGPSSGLPADIKLGRRSTLTNPVQLSLLEMT